MTVTIAICTYNRSRFLADALDALLAEPGIGERSDVLIVDNRSTDDTAAVARSYAERYPFVRVVREEEQGLSRARNRALRESDAEFVAYLDDDATVDPGWLGALLKAIASAPDADAFGGPIYPAFEVEPPSWFDPEYVTRRFGRTEGPLGGRAAREGFSGGNMAVRRDVLDALGGFDPALGMAGARVHYGEETDLFQRLYEQRGNRTYFVPAMAVRHFEGIHKQRPRFLARRMFTTGALFAPTVARSEGRAKAAALGVAKAGKQLAEGIARLPLVPFRRGQLFRAGRNLATAAGAGWGVVRLLTGREAA